MTEMTKVKLTCTVCNNVFDEIVDCIGDLTWICPKCKNKDKVYLISIDQPSKNDDPIVLGRGGCKQK